MAGQINSAQLKRELRTQVSDTSKSASSIYTIINKQNHFVTSSDRFPVPVRSAVKSNFTNWCCQNLSKCALNALTAQDQVRFLYMCSATDVTFYRLNSWQVPEKLIQKSIKRDGWNVKLFCSWTAEDAYRLSSYQLGHVRSEQIISEQRITFVSSYQSCQPGTARCACVCSIRWRRLRK